MLRLTAGVLALGLAAGGLPGWPGTASAAPERQPVVQLAQATVPPELQVMAGDHTMGKADAPVTLVEYASMTCGHCAQFHNAILPELKKKHVDTGKVRFVYRDFPLDSLALQAAQIAECAGNERYFGVVDLIFQTQAQWLAAKEPIAELGKSLRIAGMGEADIKACLANEKVATDIVAERKIAEDKLKVSSTPTLFINGQRWTGARTLEALDEALTKAMQ
ncbi:MAG TPA: DsbA family protein [Vineibacter sp.]|nr:DsbA family protein [Vineibacter sp.]